MLPEVQVYLEKFKYKVGGGDYASVYSMGEIDADTNTPTFVNKIYYLSDAMKLELQEIDDGQIGDYLRLNIPELYLASKADQPVDGDQTRLSELAVLPLSFDYDPNLGQLSMIMERVESVLVDEYGQVTEPAKKLLERDPNGNLADLIESYQKLLNAGIIHRDPHPGNIGITSNPNPRFKFIDWGKYREMDETSPFYKLTSHPGGDPDPFFEDTIHPTPNHCDSILTSFEKFIKALQHTYAGINCPDEVNQILTEINHRQIVLSMEYISNQSQSKEEVQTAVSAILGGYIQRLRQL